MPSQPTRALLAVAIAAAALFLAACGGGSDSSARATTATAADPAPQAQTLQSRFVATVKAVSPSVVEVETPVGLGSGVVLDGKGDVVTNNHVVGSYKSFQVTDSTGRRYSAKLVGTFVPDDLAVIRVSGAQLKPLAFDDSSHLQVGDIVLAVGNPLGLQSSVTQGIVSALGRTVNEDNGVALPNVIQTSAAINPGNSGGALVDLQGQVIGIPTLAATDPQLGGGQAPGIGFAIPSSTVRDIATQLIDTGKVTDSHRAYLGVNVAATTAGGLLVTDLQPGGPAARAGIRAGELIAAVNGTATPDQATLADVLAGLDPGRAVPVTVVHTDGAKRTVRVTLGQYPG